MRKGFYAAYGTSTFGPFPTFDAADKHAKARNGRGVSLSRRRHFLVGPGGFEASQAAHQRGLGDWRDKWPAWITVRYPR